MAKKKNKSTKNSNVPQKPAAAAAVLEPPLAPISAVQVIPFPQWNRFPVDVKRECIGWLYRLECAEEEESGSPPLVSAMWGNKELYDLCAPWYWQELTFQGRRLPQVQYFVDSILPIHGQHINILFFPDNVAPKKHYTGTVIYLGGNPEPRIDKDAAERRALYCTILSRLENVRALSIKLRLDQPPDPQARRTPIRTPFGFMSNLDDEEPECHLELLNAILGIAPGLESLKFYGDKESFLDANLLAPIISAAPNLKCLFLTFVGKCSNDALLTAVQSLSFAHSLELNAVEDVDERWSSSTNWTAPVVVLHLHNLLTYTPTLYADLFQHFSASLVQVRVHQDDVLDTPATPISLPHLIWLTVWSSHDVLSFVDAFVGSPLERLEIDSQGVKRYADPKKLIETAERFQETLKVLEIMSPVPRGVVEAWGAKRGIKVNVEYRAAGW
ncbi:hypothetical protein P7C70_g4335, partial [Phenoliferia sp. Uapishka_3]